MSFRFQPYKVADDLHRRTPLRPGDRVALHRFDPETGEFKVRGEVFGEVVQVARRPKTQPVQIIIWEGGNRSEVLTYPDDRGFYVILGRPGGYAVHVGRKPTTTYPQGWGFGPNLPPTPSPQEAA